MLARCARCQGTFSTDRYGRQACPHCGAELILPAPPGTPEAEASPPAPPSAPPPASPPPGPGPGAAGPPPWGPPPGGWYGAPPPPPPPGPMPELPSPFADRKRVGFFSAFFETWKLVATQPERFFSHVRTDQAWSAVLFGVVAATVGNAVAALYAYLSGKQAVVALQQMAQGLPDEQAKFIELYSSALTGSALVAQVVLSPLGAFVGIFIVAGLVHLLLMLFRGAGRGFDATLTAVAHVWGLLLLLAVPGCGSLIAAVWMAVALIIGLGAIQRCGTGKAAIAVLAPFALVCLCVCGAAGIAIPALFKGAADAAKNVQTTHL